MRALLLLTLISAGCGRIGYDAQEARGGNGDGGAANGDGGASNGDGGAANGDGGSGGPATVRLLDAGELHTCVVLSNQIYCWGDGGAGQLGQGVKASSPTPVQVLSMPAGTIQNVSAGNEHSCALVSGDAYCWGDNIYGQLGTDDKVDRLAPTRVLGLPDGQVTDILASFGHTCAVANGVSYCWGLGSAGALGVGDDFTYRLPQAVDTLSAGVSEMSVAFSQSCGIMGSQAYCWGRNDSGSLGNGSLTSPANALSPIAVLNISNTTDMAVSSVHVCAIDNGGAYCWGTGGNGGLGDGASGNSAVPVAVAGLGSGVTDITTGAGGGFGEESCAIEAGNLWCWGDGAFGRLGDGGNLDQSEPVAVPLPSAAVEVSAGQDYVCALLDTGEVRCWGRGVDGQLGDGLSTSSAVPVLVVLP